MASHVRMISKRNTLRRNLSLTSLLNVVFVLVSKIRVWIGKVTTLVSLGSILRLRNNKDGQTHMIIPKDEWKRLKKQSQPPKRPSNKQNEYVQSLIEKSRAWTEKWPDHEYGLIANYEKEKQKIHEANLAIVEEDKRKQKLKKENCCTETIREAKQKIFERSCFGKKLLSALRASKTLEERDAQIQFIKDLKKKKIIEIKPIEIHTCTFGLDEHAITEMNCRKRTTIQTALQNKALYDKQKADSTETIKHEKQQALVDKQLMKKLMELELKTEEKVRLLEKEALEQSIADHKKCKEEHAKTDAEYNAKIKRCQKEKDDLYCKINRINKEAHQASDKPWTKAVFENFIKCQEEERKRYDKLYEINNKIENARLSKETEKSKNKEASDYEKKLSIVKTNKIMAECTKLRRAEANRLTCDRQCIIVKGEKVRVKKDTLESDKNIKDKCIPLFGQRNKLVSELTKRMQQPPPWTGDTATHEHFAREADKTLRDSKYKLPGRKVVDEYMQINGLKHLDIPSYH